MREVRLRDSWDATDEKRGKGVKRFLIYLIISGVIERETRTTANAKWNRTAVNSL
jgi:hypothetical protein